MASIYRELKNLQAEISFKLDKGKLEGIKNQIFYNDNFKELALEDVLKNNLLTKEEYKLACKINSEELFNYADLDNYCPGIPEYMNLTSSLSGQEVILKMPKLKDQLVLRLLSYFLDPYVKSIPSPLSFGIDSNNSIHDLSLKIEELIYLNRPKHAFTFRVDINDPDDFKNSLIKEVPLDENLIESLIINGQISIRSLYGKEDSLSLFPTITVLSQTIVLLRALSHVYLQNSSIIRYKDEFLILSREKDSNYLVQLENILGNYGLKIDFGSLKEYVVQNYFSFLGKTYYLKDGKLQTEETSIVNDSVIEYFRSITGTPFSTSSQVNTELNKLVVLLNTYYEGVDIKDQFLTLKEVLIYNHFKNSIKGSPEEIERMIVSQFEGVETLGNVISRGTSLYELGDSGPFISSDTVHIKRHPKCFLCGRFFKRKEEAKEIIGLKDDNYVHIHCYEEIYESIKRLEMYFDFDFDRYIKSIGILKENSRTKKIRTKGIKSDWKYYPLYNFLCNVEEDAITLSFRRIESILKSKLPPSLKNGREQWFNYSKGDLTIRSSWENAGFKMVFLDVPGREVKFQKKKIGIHQIETLGLDKIEVPVEVKRTADRFFRQFINKYSLEP